jgi:RimJ/RimL family protein N-acetyltransferase
VIVAQTERLTLRRLTGQDAEFMLEVLNDPSFLRFIGDRGVRTAEQARDYILKGPVESYERLGYGMYLAELKDRHVPIGLCGLVKRDYLPQPDIGFAFLPAFRSKGYAFEAANALIKHAREEVGLSQVLAITSQDNVASISMLRKLGFGFERLIHAPGEEALINLFFVGLGQR